LRLIASAFAADQSQGKSVRYIASPTLERGAFESWQLIVPAKSTQGGYSIVRLQAEPVLDDVIQAARLKEMTVEQLVQVAITRSGRTGQSGEAEDYIRELIDSGVLVSSIEPSVTSDAAIDELLAFFTLVSEDSNATVSLAEMRERLKTSRQTGTDARSDLGHADVLLQLLPVSAEGRLPPSPLHVELWKPTAANTLGTATVQSVIAGVSALCLVGRRLESAALEEFRERFVMRYERACVPLLRALDEEDGVPFGVGGVAGPPADQTAAREFRRKVMECLVSYRGDGVPEVLLQSEHPSDSHYDIEAPGTMDVFLSVSRFEQVPAEDKPHILIRGVSSPGCRAIARFCHMDVDLRRSVADFMAAEESHRGGPVLAELVYAPRGGDVDALCRPSLRRYEIPILSRGSAAKIDTIEPNDLMVSVAPDGRVVLYSLRLEREVIPRLTNAHSYWHPLAPAVYRFLCHLQFQGCGVPSLPWEGLADWPILPRVRVGAALLALARWKVTKEELFDAMNLEGYERFDAIRKLRARRGWPRWTNLVEGDNLLAIDFDNPLSVEACVSAMRRSQEHSFLEEAFAINRDGGTGCSDGTYATEIILPVTRTPTARPPAASSHEFCGNRAGVRATSAAPTFRRLPPGGECLYVKVYGSNVALDNFASIDLRRFCQTMGPGVSWFFLRYRDPELHLRVRFFNLGDDNAKAFLAAIALRIECGDLVESSVATYQREVERYGGVEGMTLSEEIFCADSDAVLSLFPDILEMSTSERWALAAAGAASLIDRASADPLHRRSAIEHLLASSKMAIGDGSQLPRVADGLIRGRRLELDRYKFWRRPEIECPAFEGRERSLATRWSSLASLAQDGILSRPWASVVAAAVHMHINRVLPLTDAIPEYAIARALHRRLGAHRHLENVNRS
jgi:thiopeptide-type bacteriocin biosynthesis protein